MKHNFNSVGEPVQWGAMGLPSTAACSYYKCTRCGQAFEHRYNVTTNIYEAMKEHGIDPEDCPATNEEVKP